MEPLTLTVTAEDGTTTTVTAGQREMAAWEMEHFGCSSAKAGETSPVLFFRYLAYAALKRRKEIRASFAVWSEGIESVMPEEIPDEQPEDARPAEPDPTTPGRPSGG